MNRNSSEVIATLAQVSEAPALAPALEALPLGEIGFFAIAGLWLLQYFLKHSDRQDIGSWEMLRQLVQSQQETNKTLAKTNQELVLRLSRVHERLERIERVLLSDSRRDTR